MSAASRALRFALEHVAKPALAAAAGQVGESLGRRIGAKIYTPPPPEPKDGGK